MKYKQRRMLMPRLNPISRFIRDTVFLCSKTDPVFLNSFFFRSSFWAKRVENLMDQNRDQKEKLFSRQKERKKIFRKFENHWYEFL